MREEFNKPDTTRTVLSFDEFMAAAAVRAGKRPTR
jgi:hypothetical protein